MKPNKLRIENYVNNDSSNIIKLTEEWLLEAGFIQGNDDEFTNLEFHLENRATDKYSKDVNADDFGVWFGNQYLREIRYVHDLQNLYFSIYNVELF